MSGFKFFHAEEGKPRGQNSSYAVLNLAVRRCDKRCGGWRSARFTPRLNDANSVVKAPFSRGDDTARRLGTAGQARKEN